jgi:hypothetical protein
MIRSAYGKNKGSLGTEMERYHFRKQFHRF